MKQFSSFLGRGAYWASLLWVGIWLLLTSPAQAIGAATGLGIASSLAEALNPDGTLRPEAQGSFDAHQFVMHISPDGRPQFSPTRTAGTGDKNWQDGFGVPGTNGYVNAVLQVGTVTYVGGCFTVAGNVAANNLAQWDGTNWHSVGAGTANGLTKGYISTYVNALASDGTRLYVGGNFGQAGSQSAGNIAQWDGTNWSSLGTGVTSYVNALAISGTNLYVGGDFTRAGFLVANYIARWDGTKWNSLGAGTNNGANNSVEALAVTSSGVYVGGYFTSVGGGSANHVAKWDGTSWYSLGTGTTNGTTGNVYTLAAIPSTGVVYVGGSFGKAGGVTVNSVARWDNTWTALGTGTAVGVSGGPILSLVVSGSTVYIGGKFTSAGGSPANYVAKWNGTAWSNLGTGTSDYVTSLALAGTKLLVGGYFGSAGDTVADYTAQWDGTTWSSLGTGSANGANGPIWALTVAGNTVYVGGKFTAIGRVAANNVAKWDGATWSSLGTGSANGVNSDVYSIATIGNRVYVGGIFTQAGGIYSAYIAQWDGTSWSGLGSGIAYSYAADVKSMAVAGSTLYICGYFNSAGGVSGGQMAKWDGTAWSRLGTGNVDGVAYAVAVLGTDVYISGNFNNVGNVPARNIAKWDGTTWSSLGTGTANGVSNSTATSRVEALAVSGTNLYAGGTFTTAGNVTANNVARWDGTNWYSLGTTTANGVGGTTGGGVGTLTSAGTNLYVGGSFTQAGGQASSNIAKWDGTTWSSLGPGLNAPTSGIAPGPDGSIYVTGTFAAVGDGSKASSSFGVYNDVPTPILSAITPGSAVVGTTVVLTGTTLAGATTVSFNGTLATTITNNTATSLTVTIPAGATSGPVVVTTPSGVSNSLPFTVLAYPDLVVSTTTSIAPGTYNSITVTSTGNGTLAGAVVVNSAIEVQPGGILTTNCQPLTGPGSFLLASGGTLSICDPAGIAATGNTGAVQTTGIRYFSSAATYVYNGTAAQVTGDALPIQVRNLTITNPNDVTLSQGVAIAQVLTISDRGDLVQPSAAASVTLLSNATGTALMVNRSSGTLQGATATIQRAIDGSTNAGSGYRHFAPPVYGATIGSLTTTGFTPVVNSLYNTQGTSVQPFPTVYFYEESRVSNPSVLGSGFDKGWVSPDDLADQLFNARGYTLQLPATAKLSVTGRVFDNGGVGHDVYRTGSDANAGWSLVGNPYPSPIDWSLVDASDRAGLDAAMYVFESTGPYTGSYRSYTNGIGGNPIIPLGQAFFVRVSSGQTQGLMFFKGSQRVTTFNTTSFKRTTADLRPQLALSLTSATLHDITYLYQETGATTGVDPEYDAVKMPNSNGLNVSQLATTTQLAISGLPTLTAATSVPLVVGVPAAGTYTLAPITLSNLPAGLDAYLRDAQTGQTVKLTAGSSYRFDVTATQAATPVLGRFTLQFSPATPLATAPVLAPDLVGIYPNPAHGSFTVTVPPVAGATQVQAELLNSLGQVVRQHTAALPPAGAQLQIATAELPAGVYVLRLQAGSATRTKQVIIY